MTLSLEALLRRDRLIIWTGFIGVTLVAWSYMAYEAWRMTDTGVCACLGLEISGPDAGSWGALELTALFLMWAEMMVAMMVPTAAPMLLTFALVNRRRHQQRRPYVPTGLFLLGYLAVWTGFSLAAALAQWGLHAASLLSPMMVSNSHWLAAVLLIAAGLYQWAPAKDRCLAHCRSPLEFIMTDWREGWRGAFLMGWSHGWFCLGCCWCLMLLLFVLGVMNVLWIAVITLIVLAEKVAPAGRGFSRLAGAMLVGWGIWMMAVSWI